MKAAFRFILVGWATLWFANSVYAQFRLDIHRMADRVDGTLIEGDTQSETHEQQQLVGIRIAANFDQLIFNNHRTPAKAKANLQRELQTWIDKADARLELTADEKAKLWLAGASDIANCFQDATEVRLAFANGKHGEELNGALVRLRDVQKKMRGGVCGKGSMLSKVSKRMFDRERQAKANAHTVDRREFAHKASAKLVIAQIDKSMPLTIEQRELLLGVLLKHVPGSMVDHRTFYTHALARLRDQAIAAKFKPKDLARWRAALIDAKGLSQMGRTDLMELQLRNRR